MFWVLGDLAGEGVLHRLVVVRDVVRHGFLNLQGPLFGGRQRPCWTVWPRAGLNAIVECNPARAGPGQRCGCSGAVPRATADRIGPRHQHGPGPGQDVQGEAARHCGRGSDQAEPAWGAVVGSSSFVTWFFMARFFMVSSLSGVPVWGRQRPYRTV